MRLRRNFLFGKRKYLVGLILSLFISVICVAFSMGGSSDYDISRREVLLRGIGHELLLLSGDSTSRVLPVEKAGENEYRIRFEKEITFRPDSLVNTTGRLLARDPGAHTYVVNVLNCSNGSVAYGYAISEDKKDDIVTCIGREQPRACYVINIKFKPAEKNLARNGYLLGSLPLLAFVGLIFLKSVKSQRILPEEGQNTGMITLGAISFDAPHQKLIINGETIELTRTEARVLHIFALSPNEIIERSRLQKEIWEDEGVIVGRSLDMFISKLRKKLEPDPAIRIVVVRGKGYRLEVGAI